MDFNISASFSALGALGAFPAFPTFPTIAASSPASSASSAASASPASPPASASPASPPALPRRRVKYGAGSVIPAANDNTVYRVHFNNLKQSLQASQLFDEVPVALETEDDCKETMTHLVSAMNACLPARVRFVANCEDSVDSSELEGYLVASSVQWTQRFRSAGRVPFWHADLTFVIAWKVGC